MATIKIPPVLRGSVGGEKEVQASGGDVGEVLRSLASQHPATESQLFSEDGELNRYVNVYLNDEDVRVLEGLDTSVSDGDTVVILPAMAGGNRGSSGWHARRTSLAGTRSGTSRRARASLHSCRRATSFPRSTPRAGRSSTPTRPCRC